LLRIHFEKTRRQTNVYLSCAAGQHMTVKAETLNYQKNEARKNREIAQGCTKSVNLVQIFFKQSFISKFQEFTGNVGLHT
jgi:hypothetical protein